MKKLFSVLLCAIMLFCMIGMVPGVNASIAYLDPGGQLRNTGCQEARGKTSGGVDGYANMTCRVDFEHGANQDEGDRVIALTESDVHGGLSAYTTVVVWYVVSEGSTSAYSQGGCDEIPAEGFSLSVMAPNEYSYKGTAGHNAESENRGDWICGTTVLIEAD
jgi:hypothetical protein